MATGSTWRTDFWGHEETQPPLGCFLGRFCSPALQPAKVPENKGSLENHSTTKDILEMKPWDLSKGIKSIRDSWFLGLNCRVRVKEESSTAN